jgi:hypothetical protein
VKVHKKRIKKKEKVVEKAGESKAAGEKSDAAMDLLNKKKKDAPPAPAPVKDLDE